jgi:hypothetical protein
MSQRRWGPPTELASSAAKAQFDPAWPARRESSEHASSSSCRRTSVRPSSLCERRCGLGSSDLKSSRRSESFFAVHLDGAQACGHTIRRCPMPVARRLKWAASQVSAKRARTQLACVLTPDSLPGAGWRMLEQRAWRTGEGGADEPWARRARDAQLLTGWRSFEQPAASRWLWVQVTPLVSTADALAALRVVPDRFLANTRAEVTVTSARDVTLVTFDRQSGGWAYEQTTRGPRGDGVALYLATAVGSTLAVFAASGHASAWTWPQLVDVARLQIERL